MVKKNIDRLDGNDFIPLLGLASDDPSLKKYSVLFGIKKSLKIPKGGSRAIASNKKAGLEVTFIKDERALVLLDVRMYAIRRPNFKRFSGKLPHGLQSNWGVKECMKLLGKPSWGSEDNADVRWNFKGHWITLSFDNEYKMILEILIRVPE